MHALIKRPRSTHIGPMPDPIQTRAMAPATIILTCGKCARKLDGGFGHKARDSLKSVLRAANREAEPRPKLRFIETRCLGLCPHKAVAAINTALPGRIVTIPAKTPAALALGSLMGGPAGRP